MKVENMIATLVGATLLIVAIIAYILIPINAVPADPVFNGDIYAPAEGTEAFIFGTSAEQYGEWTVDGTGIYEVYGQYIYGTLYTTDRGYWVVIDPTGQAPASGSPGSEIPMR